MHFVLYLQKGLLFPVPAVSAAMKEKYLEWSYKTGGYKKARKTFTRYVQCLFCCLYILSF